MVIAVVGVVGGVYWNDIEWVEGKEALRHIPVCVV